MKEAMSLNPVRKVKESIFYDQTTSLCETCLKLVPAKVIFENQNVYYDKYCREHGKHKTLISTDVEYYKKCKEYYKESDLPHEYQTQTVRGCPYDCGLCPDHEQHTCLALIEINEHCNLSCPVCFAQSSPQRKHELSYEQYEKMLELLIRSEKEPDLLQISGGEPTLHPRIIDFLRLAKQKPIRHLMLNTNGVRIANDESFVKELSTLKPGFEVYLQFDSLKPTALLDIRGVDLLSIREKALEKLEKYQISTTLVVVVKKGCNDDELGAILQKALSYKCVRGVTFQPVQDAGRNESFDPKKNRMVLSEIRKQILEQSQLFQPQDIVPLPCNPDAISIAYGLRDGKKFLPVTSWFADSDAFKKGPNTISYERYPELKKRVFDLLSLATTEHNSEFKLKNLLCCLPQFEVPSELSYDRVFRIVIMQFLDRYNFCLAQVKRSCVHFVTEDARIIPFDTYNLFHRKALANE